MSDLDIISNISSTSARKISMKLNIHVNIQIRIVTHFHESARLF